jgi:hypothetical protein
MLTTRACHSQLPVPGSTGEEREVPGAYIEFAERRALPEFADMPVGSASFGPWLTFAVCTQW